MRKGERRTAPYPPEFREKLTCTVLQRWPGAAS